MQLPEDNAKKATESGIFFDDDRQYKRNERCNKAGGGAQSRAIKTKSTMENLRGKAAANKDGDEEHDNFEDGNVKKSQKPLELVNITEIVAVINRRRTCAFVTDNW